MALAICLGLGAAALGGLGAVFGRAQRPLGGGGGLPRVGRLAPCRRERRGAGRGLGLKLRGISGEPPHPEPAGRGDGDE
ncbi:MAG: hypothetical protein U1F37_01815 [Alphaproteobacteria bacterium]